MRKLTFLRLVVATLVVGAAIVVLQLGGRPRRIGVALRAPRGDLPQHGVGLPRGQGRRAVSRADHVVEIALDCAVLTMMLHYSGGSASHFADALRSSRFSSAGDVFPGVRRARDGGARDVALRRLQPPRIRRHVDPPARRLDAAGPEAETVQALCCAATCHMAVFVLAGLLSGYLSTMRAQAGRGARRQGAGAQAHPASHRQHHHERFERSHRHERGGRDRHVQSGRDQDSRARRRRGAQGKARSGRHSRT